MKSILSVLSMLAFAATLAAANPPASKDRGNASPCEKAKDCDQKDREKCGSKEKCPKADSGCNDARCDNKEHQHSRS